MPKIPIGLQLYTLRDIMKNDFAGTIRKVADIGYSAVELAGHGDLSVRELSALLEDNHLKVAGSHISLDLLESDLPKVIEENLKLGNAHIVVPYLAEERRKTADDYKVLAETLNNFGMTLQTSGMISAITTTILSSSRWKTDSLAKTSCWTTATRTSSRSRRIPTGS